MSDTYTQLLQAVSAANRSLFPDFEFFRKSSPDSLQKVVPSKTLSISLTEKDCEQNCAHCNGHYLKGMNSIHQALKNDLSGYDSVLISGGSDSTGRVNFAEHIGAILQLPGHLQLNLHPGFQTPDKLEALVNKTPTISFDIPADDTVINQVYGLPYSSRDYRELFLSYLAKFRTIPHITLGLNSQSNKGELETLDFLASQELEMVVFIVFRPTPGTRMSDSPPPDMKRLQEVFVKAKNSLKCPVLLGCMRPAGQYRTNLDILSWMHGIKKIVQPDHKLLKILQENRIPVETQNSCCSLKSKGL